MSTSKHFTTSKPRTIFSVGQMAKFAGVARSTVVAKWEAGRIKAIGLDAKERPLFDAAQSAKITDGRYKGDSIR